MNLRRLPGWRGILWDSGYPSCKLPWVSSVFMSPVRGAVRGEFHRPFRSTNCNGARVPRPMGWEYAKPGQRYQCQPTANKPLISLPESTYCYKSRFVQWPSTSSAMGGVRDPENKTGSAEAPRERHDF